MLQDLGCIYSSLLTKTRLLSGCMCPDYFVQLNHFYHHFMNVCISFAVNWCVKPATISSM